MFFFQAEDGIRDYKVTGVQTCALPISPFGRRGEPEEVAAVVRMLCGPDARYITGQTVHVNGGGVFPRGGRGLRRVTPLPSAPFAPPKPGSSRPLPPAVFSPTSTSSPSITLGFAKLR